MSSNLDIKYLKRDKGESYIFRQRSMCVADITRKFPLEAKLVYILYSFSFCISFLHTYMSIDKISKTENIKSDFIREKVFKVIL